MQVQGNPTLLKNIPHKARHEHVPKEIMEVAQGMETQFIHNLIEELEKSVEKAEPDDSATQYYKSLLNFERAKIMGENQNGLGIKDLIVEQLSPKAKMLQMNQNPYGVNTNNQNTQSNKGDNL